jgi:FMN-dependent NADH-azoreductase
MTTILEILVSPRVHSHSLRIAEDIVSRIAERCAGARIIVRDLAADPPPHPGFDLYEAILSPTPDDDPRFVLSERLIAELEGADFVVIGTPMNNFTVPSTLKAWIDHIVRIRRSFRSTPEGKVGLLPDRPVIVVSAHGGYCGSMPPAQPRLSDAVSADDFRDDRPPQRRLPLARRDQSRARGGRPRARRSQHLDRAAAAAIAASAKSGQRKRFEDRRAHVKR